MWNWLKTLLTDDPVGELQITGSGSMTSFIERLDREFKLHLNCQTDIGNGQQVKFNIIIDDTKSLISLSALLANAVQRLDSPYYSAEDLGPLWEDEHPDIVEDIKEMFPDAWMEWITSPNIRFGSKTPLEIIQQGKAHWIREVLRSIKCGVMT